MSDTAKCEICGEPMPAGEQMFKFHGYSGGCPKPPLNVKKKRLYDEYIRRLVQVNDETKTVQEHEIIIAEFGGWKQGVEDAAGHRFNGDYYYLEKFASGEMVERPLCCGEFLDWQSQSIQK